MSQITPGNTTDTHRVKAQIRNVARNVRHEARRQGRSFWQLWRATGIPFRKFLRLWVGADTAAWTVLKTTATLGVPNETIWGSR